MAPYIRFNSAPFYSSYTFYGFLRHGAVEHVDLYLE
jgi:hypothetical protein